MFKCHLLRTEVALNHVNPSFTLVRALLRKRLWQPHPPTQMTASVHSVLTTLTQVLPEAIFPKENMFFQTDEKLKLVSSFSLKVTLVSPHPHHHLHHPTQKISSREEISHEKDLISCYNRTFIKSLVGVEEGSKRRIDSLVLP